MGFVLGELTHAFGAGCLFLLYCKTTPEELCLLKKKNKKKLYTFLLNVYFVLVCSYMELLQHVLG